MDYLITFLEGIITFISPCILPMIPIYIGFFTGQQIQDKRRPLKNALGFIMGFTLVFVAMGASAGVLGQLINQYDTLINIIMGVIMILFGLNYMSVIKLPFINANRQMVLLDKKNGFFAAMIFGIIFSISWTPCVGAFLGSALMLAASQGGSVKGILLLLSFSLGLGIPFLASALIIDRLKRSFDFIKRHYNLITLISGIFLLIIGIMMATGLIGYFLALMTL